MTETVSARKIWTAGGWIYNSKIHIENGKIRKIESLNNDSSFDVPLLIPGMIELHAHGSLGYNSANPDKEGNKIWLRRLAEHGTTGTLPTLSSHPSEKIREAVAFYDAIRENPVDSGAAVLGVHLEGPFLNHEKRGGINPLYIKNPSIEHYKELVGEHSACVKQVTLAPELEGAAELIPYLKERGVAVNAGHSDATTEEMRRAISLGLDGVTHFFNAARPINHRDPGLLTAALLDDRVFCEMVSDLVHLAPEIIHLLIKCAGAKRLCVITDAVTLTGMPDGKYENGCVVVDGSPRKDNGTLTGGRYLMDGCVKALIEIGVDPWDVFCMTSHTPARRLSMTGIGDIAEGFAANLVAMDENYEILYTVIGGKRI